MIVLAAALALANGERVTIPAGYYTLPEIAARLSTPSERVTCRREVSNRLLFVSISDKPLGEVERDLSSVLGVGVWADGAGGQEIGPDLVRRYQESRLAGSMVDYFEERLSLDFDSLMRGDIVQSAQGPALGESPGAGGAPHEGDSESLSFDPYSGRLTSRLLGHGPESGTFDEPGIVPDHVGMPYPRLAEIGDDAWVRGYLTRRDESRSLLDSDLGQASVAIPAGSRSVSGFIAAWTTQTERDVIMEVSPGRDLSPNRFETARADCCQASREVLGSVAECELEMGADGPADESPACRAAAQALARAIAAEPTYTCRLSGQILCVRDEFGFLDHTYGFPLSAIAELANVELRQGSAGPTLEDVQRFRAKLDRDSRAVIARFRCALLPADVVCATTGG